MTEVMRKSRGKHFIRNTVVFDQVSYSFFSSNLAGTIPILSLFFSDTESSLHIAFVQF